MLRYLIKLAALAALLSFTRSDHHESQDSLPEDHEEIKHIHQKASEFAFRLYKAMSEQSGNESKNLFFSPASISMAMAAMSLGARGETLQQLITTLGLNDSNISVESVHQVSKTFLEGLNKKEGVETNAGSALFVNKGFKLHPKFLDNLKHFYLADGFGVDFTNSTETTNIINTYVKEKTHGKIDKLVDSLDRDTVMFLLTYIYFKGKWAIPFDPQNTEEDLFNVDNKTAVPVQMMQKKDTFDMFYDEVLSTNVLRLHYNDSVSMMLVLPDKGLAELEQAVTPGHLEKWQQGMVKKECRVLMPKLSIKTSYSMKSILMGFGLKDMFTSRANLSGISDHPLLVSEVMHQATLDVDEAGATAAGVTGMIVTLLSLDITPEIVLKFNRPYMVFVINHDTNCILFMGKIVNP